MKTASMTAAFLWDDRLHAARYVKTFAQGWCGMHGAEGDGIYYVPCWAFDGRTTHGDVGVCIKCSAALCALAEPA